ncbi:unnamed protein product [Lupinus luteus]|uniref:Uncharacterized protein n=1 Tax=Lupinus luteus TaxID=3873 RepID=A0AAV1XY01_LUPLU
MKRASPSNTTSHVNNQHEVHAGSHPPPGQAYPTATNVSVPLPVDYPLKDDGPPEYPKRGGSYKTKSCACFCRNLALDECFD